MRRRDPEPLRYGSNSVGEDVMQGPSGVAVVVMEDGHPIFAVGAQVEVAPDTPGTHTVAAVALAEAAAALARLGPPPSPTAEAVAEFEALVAATGNAAIGSAVEEIAANARAATAALHNLIATVAASAAGESQH